MTPRLEAFQARAAHLLREARELLAPTDVTLFEAYANGYAAAFSWEDARCVDRAVREMEDHVASALLAALDELPIIMTREQVQRRNGGKGPYMIGATPYVLHLSRRYGTTLRPVHIAEE